MEHDDVDEADGLNGLDQALIALATFAAATLARKVVVRAWAITTGRKAPSAHEQGDDDWRVVVMFAAATGAAVGVARTLAERRTVGVIARKKQGNV